MMKFRIITTALLLGLALPAAADFTTIVEGHEVSIKNVRLPQTQSGTIAYKRCNTCPYETKRVAADVSWEFNGSAMRLERFRDRIAAIADRNWVITVGHHLQRDEIVRVTAWVPESMREDD